MVDIHVIDDDPTLLALDAALEEESRALPSRDYLGASAIGDPCERRLWYRLRRPGEQFNAKTLRRFIDGHRTEDLVISWLKKIEGLIVWEKDNHGQQFGFKDDEGFRGSCDGVIKGLKQCPDDVCVLEIKAVNDKKFNKLVKLKYTHGEHNALAEWDETYYAQAVIYMHKMDLPKHYLVCASPGGRDLTSVMTLANPVFAEQLIRKAHKIIKSPTEPPRMTDNPDYFQCRWCNFRQECHGLG